MIKVKIVSNDSKIVAKAVILDEKNRVLLLKRSDYVEKHAGEWDLPGGNLKEKENLRDGLLREVKEETGLSLRRPKYVQTFKNIHFFMAKYDSQEIVISHEHTEYNFFEKKDLNRDERFQKIAIEVIEIQEASD